MLKLPKLIILSFSIALSASFGGAAEEINIDTLDISEKAKALLKKEQKHWCDPIAEGVNTFSFDSNPVTSIVLGMDGENAEIIEYNKFISPNRIFVQTVVQGASTNTDVSDAKIYVMPKTNPIPFDVDAQKMIQMLESYSRQITVGEHA